ncbi:MAG TPA: DUF2971 domain-containing protein [Burkholderiaceae bacterium]|nr:DUF2971 domain-containing protein [Burkholderiaceae bacterium]
MLLNRKLFFASPSQLNDPLDSSIDIEAEYERAREILNRLDDHPERRKLFLLHMLNEGHQFQHRNSGETVSLNKALAQFIQSLGILSLSRTPTDPLLWSHYSAGHSGLCLEFDGALLEIDSVFIRDDVSYLPRPPYVDLFLKMTEELGEFFRPWDNYQHSPEQADKFYTLQLSRLMRANLLVKSEKWKYEEEHRLITTRPGLAMFSPKALIRVIRGTKMAESDRETLASILRHPDYSHVLVCDAVHVPGTFEFGLSESMP